jgi:hypothetical protein
MDEKLTVDQLYYGRLFTLDKKYAHHYDAYSGPEGMNGAQFTFWGHVIGIVENQHFVDLIAREKFPIIRIDASGKPILNNAVESKLYVRDIVKAELAFGTFKDVIKFLYLSRKRVTPKNLNALRTMMDKINLIHISDDEVRKLLHEKYPMMFNRPESPAQDITLGTEQLLVLRLNILSLSATNPELLPFFPIYDLYKSSIVTQDNNEQERGKVIELTSYAKKR